MPDSPLDSIPPSALIKPLTPSEAKEQILRKLAIEQRRDLYRWERGSKAFFRNFGGTDQGQWRTAKAEELERQGWEIWLKTLAPHVFSGDFGFFHREYWNWYWELLMLKQKGIRLAALGVELAYLLTLGRGMGKSSCMEWDNIAFGATCGRVLGLYISSTGDLAKGHLTNIREEIEGSKIDEYYPGMAHPELGKFNNRYGWNQELLVTKSGLALFAVGLQGEVRGIKRMNLRPGKITLDEFDSKTDSADVVKSKESIIGGSIFGTQTGDTIITMGQNLIRGDSVATRTFKRRNQLLNFRKESGLVRAFTSDLEVKMVGTRYMINKGKPTWPYLDLMDCQKMLDDAGPIEFFAEYQHQFDWSKEGRVMKNYVDAIHVISEEEFCRAFQFKWYPGFRMPFDWFKYLFHDKARTKTEYHANVAGTLTMSSENTRLPGVTFLYDCLSFEANTAPDDCAIAFLRCISPLVRVNGVERDWDELRRSLISRSEIANFVGSQSDKIKAERSGLAKVFPEHVKPLIKAFNYKMFRMSHEADDWARVYSESFGIPFERLAFTEDAGQALIDFSMNIDYNIQDPFERYGYWSEDKQTFTRDPERSNPASVPLMGMSRWYMVVKNEQLPYPDDNRPDLLHGSDLARHQFNEQKYLAPKLNALGEHESDAEKKNDDYRNGMQMFYMDHSIRGRALSKAEQVDLTLPEPIQTAAIDAEPDPLKKAQKHYAHELAIRQREQAGIEKRLLKGGSKAKNSLVSYKKMMRRGG